MELRWSALGVAAAVLLSACSVAGTGTGHTFDTSGPTPSFSIPPPGSGRCPMDYRAQVSLVDPANGSTRWTQEIPWPVGAKSTVADGLVFVASDSSVVAVRLSDGRPVWQRPITATSGSPELQVAGGRLIVLEPRSGQWSVVALTPRDGRQVWRQDLSGSSNDPVQVDANSVFDGDGHGHLVAFDARTGARRWVARFGADNTSVSLTLARGRLFARGGGSASGVAAFDPATGRRLWAAADGETIVVIGVTGSVLIALAFPPHGLWATTIAFRLDDGRQAWARRLPGPPQTAAPTLASDQIVSYATTAVAGVDRADGRPRWTAPIKAGAAAGDRSRLLVTSPSTHQLMALDPQTGATVWAHDTGSDQMATPDLMAGGTVYLGVERSSTGWNEPRNGALEAIDAATGQARWTAEVRDGVLTEPVSTPEGLVVTSADSPLFCD